ncbi:hypothetical protein METBIDRAFT_30181 [Metschnikowia bicuspidata var. bicuspidata NRRL YB-4993]|uniref:Uncharacterized protein n=1 Tax=Metschnikowia bicuspidata var. bicuspidata NRRL YB-4993 TaxID=869754 RepID=A0A1A0HIW3_9ASCO|nr:hypothetical protein METBIDRAFT_30181 [Metschnikowia bicuspidata var. bicuspidata NRRL YB-4993]OBA23778.1 hypothetical protein METBIDRAFT_30181 [Metschnikowia bicuspidata var. bicuspidata NRRL YB-4993]
MRQWHSSPTRDLTSYEQIEQRQRTRADMLYQPMLSPTKNASQTSQKHKLREKMRQMRDDLREERKELSREKTVHDEDVRARLKLLQEQAELLEIDLDLLLQEEIETCEETSGKNNGTQITCRALAPSVAVSENTRHLSEFEEELEDLLAAEEMELEARFGDLQL